MALSISRSNQPAQAPRQWDPFTEFEDLQARLGQLMESAWSGLGDGEKGIWLPLVDVEETEDAWVVEAELPGAKRNDVHVELRDHELAIFGEIKERERKGILRRRTRRTGRFEYRVTIPGEADPDAIDASLHDGVLTVRVPKAARERPREIEVKVA